VAVPLFDYEGAVVAGVNISMLMTRFSKIKIYKEYLPLLIEEGKLISREIGFMKQRNIEKY
jgi:DNA-binding IclR family transcriptional regulator